MEWHDTQTIHGEGEGTMKTQMKRRVKEGAVRNSTKIYLPTKSGRYLLIDVAEETVREVEADFSLYTPPPPILMRKREGVPIQIIRREEELRSSLREYKGKVPPSLYKEVERLVSQYIKQL